MQKVPHLEINTIPSALNTSAPTGVASQLANVAENQPNYDGITIQQMKGNPLYERIDDIDKIGLAQKRIVENAKTIKSNSRKIRALNDAINKPQKPSTRV